jgi:hypothetical protein
MQTQRTAPELQLQYLLHSSHHPEKHALGLQLVSHKLYGPSSPERDELHWGIVSDASGYREKMQTPTNPKSTWVL